MARQTPLSQGLSLQPPEALRLGNTRLFLKCCLPTVARWPEKQYHLWEVPWTFFFTCSDKATFSQLSEKPKKQPPSKGDRFPGLSFFSTGDSPWICLGSSPLLYVLVSSDTGLRFRAWERTASETGRGEGREREGKREREEEREDLRENG
jgi:hypothetical protein